MAMKPDIEKMVIALDSYLVDLEDEKTKLEEEMEEEENNEDPDTGDLEEEIEVLSDRIKRAESAIEALENL